MIRGNRQDKYAGRNPTADIADGAVKLGHVVRQVLENQISPRQGRFSAVIEAWQRLVPVEFACHCKLVDLTAGVLKVMVDSPSYMYELQLCRSALLSELQRECARARIRKIKLAVG
jgi:predicted nucleic acid-binding Zn ribbon protein